jgi:uncharacterized protein YjiS (DUF1127 family)
MSDFTYGDRSASTESTLPIITKAFAKTAIETLREWRHNYRSRRELAMYSHRERSDLRFAGDVETEIQRPFWRK